MAGSSVRTLALAAALGSSLAMRSDVETLGSLTAEEETAAADKTKFCQCANPLNGLWPKDCCQRTDAGSLKWKSGEGTTCAALEGHSDCQWYCEQYLNCAQVAHKDDQQNAIDYLGEKIGEIGNLPEDIMLARASWPAQMLQDKSCARQANVKVAGVHQLHPVGSWREDTWAKTERRKNAVLAAKATILSHGKGGVLTEQDLLDVDVLSPMRSVTPFIAVPFPYCGNSHVLLEGNGRVRGMKLAAAEDPALKDMSVEVTLLCYTRENMKTVHDGIAALWNQYATMMDSMNATAEAGRIQEYSQFKVNVGTCQGTSAGLFSARQPCPIVSGSGKRIGEVPVGDKFGISAIHTDPRTKAWRYEMCGAWSGGGYAGPAYVLSEGPGVVSESCPTCSQHLINM